LQNAKALNKKEISTAIWQLEELLCPHLEGGLLGMEMATSLS
jgi:hypothetical protein